MALLHAPGRKSRDEAEKPFWISFSDLMTALMVLFLVAMAVALLAVAEEKWKSQRGQRERAAAVDECMADVADATRKFPDVRIHEHSIDFGAEAEFPKAMSDLRPDQEESLRKIVPDIIAITKRPQCQSWLKRVVVDGYASQEGGYLYNLNLSIQRSERVLCVLLDPKAAHAPSEQDRRLIQKLFFVGGSSWNSLKTQPSESRRVELKVEFYDFEEVRSPNAHDIALSTDTCPIGQR